MFTVQGCAQALAATDTLLGTTGYLAMTFCNVEEKEKTGTVFAVKALGSVTELCPSELCETQAGRG